MAGKLENTNPKKLIMATINLDEIKLLLQKQGPPCVSIYLPLDKGLTDSSQNSIRFRNLLRKTEGILAGRNWKKTQIDKFLDPMRTLVADPLYWHQPSEGLAIFLSAGLFKVFRMPRKVTEQLIVNDRFCTKPLLPLLFENGRFFILAVSQKGARFLECTRDSFNELELPDLPKGIDEILKQYVGERHVEFHTGSPRQTGSRQAYPAFHGQGGGSLNSDDKVLGYLYQVDKGLRRHLQNEHVPLVFAGVEFLFPMYKQANTYQNLVGEPVKGNPDRLSAAQLHQQALAVVAPRLEQKKQQMFEIYNQFAGTGRTSADPADVVLKASQGRVDTLFITEKAQVPGRFDSDSGTVELHASKQPNSEDLLDLGANETFLNSGTVYELAPGRLPEDSPMAAILRY